MKVDLSSLEPFLQVRHYYALAIHYGLLSRSSVRSVLGHNYGRVLRGAKRSLSKISKGGCPQLRPRGVWEGKLKEKASISSSFGRLLVNHGLDKDDMFLLSEENLLSYVRNRLLGMTQHEACVASDNTRKVSLDDEVIHKMQVRKFPNFKPNRVISKKWTRGAVKSYSKLINGWGGCVINKSGLTKDRLMTESRNKLSHSAVTIMERMAVLSHRVVRLFTNALINRDILEFSEVSPEEFDLAVKDTMLIDWRLVSSGGRSFIRCYWSSGFTKFVKTNRTESSGGKIVSSFDIPLSSL